jgi:hypothetical protein
MLPRGEQLRRAALVGPVAFTLIGGAAGICWAMLYRPDLNAWATVRFDESVPALFIGSLVGLFVGAIVFVSCTLWPKLLSFATLIATVLLGMGITAPIGWFAEDNNIRRMGTNGMQHGAIIGAVGGLMVGTLQCYLDNRRRTRLDS